MSSVLWRVIAQQDRIMIEVGFDREGEDASKILSYSFRLHGWCTIEQASLFILWIKTLQLWLISSVEVTVLCNAVEDYAMDTQHTELQWTLATQSE